MKDSFDNTLQIGDKILCIKPREEYSHRELQVGIICGIADICGIAKQTSDIVVDFLNTDYSSIEEILDHLLTCLNPAEDTFVKIETHKEVEYKVGDKIIHDTFKQGIVVGVDKSILTIAFPHPIGIKKLLKGHKSIKKV